MTDSVSQTVHAAIRGQSLRVATIFIALGSASLSWPAVADPATSASAAHRSTVGTAEKMRAGRAGPNLVRPAAAGVIAVPDISDAVEAA